MENISAISPKNLAALKELQEKLKSAKFDPNEPINKRLLGVLKDFTDVSTDENLAKIANFCLIPPQCEFVSDAEFMANPRLRLLELRSQQVPEYRNLRMIPALVKEIPADIFTAYEQKLIKEKERIDVTDMDAYRAVVNRYISSVREEILLRLQISKVTRLWSDVVNEDSIPTFGSLGFACATDVGRPLKPARKDRKKVAIAPKLAGGEVKILVNIIRAIGIPIRVGAKSSEAGSSHHKEEVTLEPFVEVTFQHVTQRTSWLQGNNPTWNQQLVFDFKAPNNDFSSSNLQSVKDFIYFNVFDHDTIELPKDSRDGDIVVHRQEEKRWLGSFKVPFSTAYHSGKPIRGTFRLNVPPVLLGYKLDSSTKFPHLELIIAIEPPLVPPEPIYLRNLESVESVKLREFAHDWLMGLSKAFVGRRFVPLVVDTNGRAVSVCRFLRDIRPPGEILDLWQSNEREALNLANRLVSLIPFISDPVLFPGLCDIWSTSEQFVNLLCGDEEEHGVLLCCWLLSLGVESALVLGSGLPEGPHSAYVLAKVAPEAILFNPSTGQSFLLSDSLCPLTSVGCVVTRENLYANIQPKSHPSLMSFDFADVVHWRPFFSKKFPNPGLTSIQVELNYKETSRVDTIKLQERVETAVKERLFAWRSKTITRTNVFAIQIFRQLLNGFESGVLAADQEEIHNEALKSLMETHKISGFPLNFSYTTTEDIIEAVRATNVWKNFHPDVEFALAVHIHPYPNGILSVWVYIASLIKRR